MVVSSRYVELQLRMPTVRIQFVFLQQTLVYCGQMVGQIKMKLGMEVGLGPGHVVLDGDPASPSKNKRSTAPNFRPMFIVAKWLDGSRCHLVRR